MESTNNIARQFSTLQQSICKVLEVADGQARFEMNLWNKEIGSGVSGVMQNGKHIEKAAVNFSKVGGAYTSQMEKLLGEKATAYHATGVSSIIHPVNAHVPIIHMNVRYFELDTGVRWFGGGIDLTPHYIIKEDAAWFHKQLKITCDHSHPDFYTRFKSWADEYFYLPHRKETRGVGGIFFDRIKPDEKMGELELIKFCLNLGHLYPQIYAELIQRNGNKPVSDQQRQWQLIRRGRYVEFNLLFDKGTKFGLESDGNTESILLSMPPDARWEYLYEPNEDSPEKITLGLLKKGINWIDEK